jgi:hypothetical protein
MLDLIMQINEEFLRNTVQVHVQEQQSIQYSVLYLLSCLNYVIEIALP